MQHWLLFPGTTSPPIQQLIVFVLEISEAHKSGGYHSPVFPMCPCDACFWNVDIVTVHFGMKKKALLMFFGGKLYLLPHL